MCVSVNWSSLVQLMACYLLVLYDTSDDTMPIYVNQQNESKR